MSCRYFHEYFDRYPQAYAINLQFKSSAVSEVIAFAFCGMCSAKYSGGRLISDDFKEFCEFLACLNFIKPLMYMELLWMFDESYCRKFQKHCNSESPPCESNTILFLRLAIKWGFSKLEAMSVARIVDVFPDTYALHLNAEEQPDVVRELVKERYDYEMYSEQERVQDEYARVSEPQMSALERIELLKAKCKQVYKWVGADSPNVPPRTPPRSP
ncbi:unnamed protein product [Gongylonema pulchrum]|uniref:FRIGIDA-like protein n=1 Tax=Gongylonema pulchrum TaxID=637853 RepID=A0A183DUE7_9BILA|nr:unnamed protein product [Gongylonema pulchrum]